MKSRLITLFVLAGLLPVLITSFLSYPRGKRAMNDMGKLASDSMQKQVETQLQTLRAVSRQRVEDYFDRTIKQCMTISSYPSIVNAATEFSGAIKNFRAERTVPLSPELGKSRHFSEGPVIR